MLLCMLVLLSLPLGEEQAPLPTRSATEAGYYIRLGEAYLEEGKLVRAADAYRLASDLTGNSDITSLKRLATLEMWTRQFTDARSRLERGLQLNPADGELRGDLADLNTQRSLHLFGFFGSSDVDFTKRAFQAGLFIGYIDWLDAYASYTMTDRIFYQRATASVDAYVFPVHWFYVRISARLRQYTYPEGETTRPDENAYSQVPAGQIEAGFNYGRVNTFSFEAEYFRPNFYWNPALNAHNVKLSVGVTQWIAGPIYVKVFAALLRDPDPASFIADGKTNLIQSYEYEQVGFLGGGIGFDNGPLTAEARYVPDRDLDRSIAWSIFGRIGYHWESFSIRYDMVFDRFAGTSSRGVPSSRVDMITAGFRPLRAVELSAGAKALNTDRTEIIPFVALLIRTGL